jgi:hypothetical protein
MAFNRITKGRGLTGALNVGGGTTVKKIETGTVVVDFPNTGAANTSSATFTVTGVEAGDVLVLNTASLIGTAASFTLSHVAALSANTGVAWGFNGGAASVNPASVNFTYLWVDVT